jgi:hypothetical protein
MSAVGEAFDFASEAERSAEQENEATHKARQRQPDMRNRDFRLSRRMSSFAHNFPQALVRQVHVPPARTVRRLDLASLFSVFRI